MTRPGGMDDDDETTGGLPKCRFFVLVKIIHTCIPTFGRRGKVLYETKGVLSRTSGTLLREDSVQGGNRFLSIHCLYNASDRFSQGWYYIPLELIVIQYNKCTQTLTPMYVFSSRRFSFVL